MVETSTVISIVSAVLGSSLILGGITAFFSEVINTPKIQYRDEEIPNRNGVSVGLTNEGRAAAKNLYITAISDVDVDYEIFATENNTIITDNNRTLTVYFPRFMHGKGSWINMNIIPSEQTGPVHLSNQNYTIAAVYDQGTALLPPQEEPFLISIGMTVLFTIAGVIAFCIPYFYRRGKRSNQRWAANLIRENISYYKERFEKDNGKNDIAINRDAVTLSENISNFKDLFKHHKSNMSNDKDDFGYVEDFYHKLALRNIKLEEATKEERSKIAKDLNKDVVTAAETAQMKINWTHYGVNKTRILNRIKGNYNPQPTIFQLSYYSGISMVWMILRPLVSILIIPLVLIVGSFWINGDPFTWVQKFQMLEIELIIIGGVLAVLFYGFVRPDLPYESEFPRISTRPKSSFRILIPGLIVSIIINIILLLMFFHIIG